MNNNDRSKPAGKAVQPASPTAPAKQESQFVELQDIMPVMTSFREYIDEEQKRTQARLRLFTWIFGVAAVGLLIVPIYLATTFARQSQKATEAQIAAQARIAEAILGGLERVTEASRVLRSELALQRLEQLGDEPADGVESMIAAEETAGATAVEPTPIAGEAVEAVAPVEPVPAAAIEPAPAVDVPAEPSAAAPEPAVAVEETPAKTPPAQEKEAPAVDQAAKAPAPAMPAEAGKAAAPLAGGGEAKEIILPSVADRMAVQPGLDASDATVKPDAPVPGKDVTDLERLLMQVEKAIADKERALRLERERQSQK